MTLRSTQRGMSQLESLLGLLAVISLMTLCSTVLQQHRERAVALATVRQLKAVAHAARTYVADHAAEFTTPHNSRRRPRAGDNTRDLPFRQLIDAGYLPRHFQQKNAYQQAYKIRVCRHNTLAQWQVWVTTEQGRAIPLRDWKSMGPLLGDTGAYANERGGKMLSWQASWDDSARNIVKPGHLVLYHSVQAPDLYSNDTLLYRKKSPTHPQRQQMTTDLDLPQQAIVFEAPQRHGTVSAQGAQFEHTTTAGVHHALIDLSSGSTGTASQIRLNNPKQHQLRISPSAVQITAPSLMSRRQKNHFDYDPTGKKVTLITSHGALPPHYGSQLHREWNQIPYHHLPYYEIETEENRQKKLYKTAQRICLLEQHSQQNQLKIASKQSNLYPHLGRLFIVGNSHHQQSTLFICGKPQFGQQVRPYSIYSAPPLLQKKIADPFPPIERVEKKQVTGLKLRDFDKSDPQTNLQKYLFLYDSIEKILFFIHLEETILNTNKGRKVDYQKAVNFIEKIKKSKENSELLKKIKNSQQLEKRIKDFKNLPTEFYLHNTSKHIPELFFNYCLDRCPNKDNRECDKVFLESILTQLKQCEKKPEKNTKTSSNEFHRSNLDEEKVKRVFGTDNVKTFLLQCKEFEQIPHNRWMQTVYILSTDQHLAQHPLCELNLTDLPLN
ncbi:shufflon system plasmid conjugative transfer pilus tip adhesin PilV [unidentified bacterial endosymbiont]|uniref:shufflon system plasmid conjugative transfer pilus tip adhesin PilV n=1 Tax=unidentified bacterial endosymbiont TaxID=2355 RepID=UPI0020A0B286|nr:shufflon system plasmid conjugative transfer pilus tip adhesin PilV [unidentified bacterial endosymbiont]